jgi:hypothetical protein
MALFSVVVVATPTVAQDETFAITDGADIAAAH